MLGTNVHPLVGIYGERGMTEGPHFSRWVTKYAHCINDDYPYPQGIDIATNLVHGKTHTHTHTHTHTRAHA